MTPREPAVARSEHDRDASRVGLSDSVEAVRRLPLADTDAELWQRLPLADEQAFAELFNRHRDAVYTYAFRRTASWSVAEDVTQATFTTLWRRARQGRIDRLRLDSARPVLLAMARDECGNANRALRRQSALVDRAGSHQVGAAGRDDVDRWVEAETTMRAIRALLGKLPRNQRDLIELVAWAELPVTEAAAVLGIPVGTAKSRLSRARARLLETGAAALLHQTEGRS